MSYNEDEKRSAVALLRAVDAGDHRETKRLLDMGVFPNTRDVYGLTPLFSAVERAEPRQVRALLEAGADAAAADMIGNTPLHHAAFVLNNAAALREIMRMLLANGADPYAKADDDVKSGGFSQTPSDYARIQRNADFLAIFTEYENGELLQDERSQELENAR